MKWNDILIIRIMKYSFFGLFLNCFFLTTLMATGTIKAQTSVKEKTVEINFKKSVKLRKVFEFISSETDYSFNYTKELIDIDKEVNINSGKVTVESILIEISRQLGLAFKQVNNAINVSIIKDNGSPVEVEVTDDIGVSGKVLDETGAPLPGVSVLLKGTDTGTITDASGNYSLIATEDGVLVFSFLGYETTEVAINGRSVIDIEMEPDFQQLSEIVVVGYGTQQRKEITGSVVSVSAENFNKGNVSNPIQLLQGKVAGLQIGKVGGNPNQPFTVRIRGVNSIQNSTEPLVVIDGVLGGALDALDPNDIASIEILKDASASAIYGARASAGVLLVTTKTGDGDTGRPRLSYNGFVAFDEISNNHEVASAKEYRALTGSNDLGSNTDWIEEVTQTGVSNVHNISLSNSANGLIYRFSLNTRNVQNTLKNSAEFDQVNARLNISQKLFDDRLTLSGSLAATSREEDQGFQHSLAQSLYYNPTAPVFDADGSYFEAGDQDRYNPVAINDQNSRDRKFNRQVSTIRGEYQVIDNLVVSSIYTLQRSSELIGEYSARDALWGGSLVNGWARRATVDNTYQQFDGTIAYFGEAGELGYTITGGYSGNIENIQEAVAANTDFVTDEFSYNNLAAGQGINNAGVVVAEINAAQPQNFVGSNQRESKATAYFLRANLNYADSYFFSGSYRREGSSRFGFNNRWGDFWALNGGANITNIVDLPLDQLKVRVGYGVTGTLPDEFYGYLETLGLSTGGFANGGFISGVTPATGSNPDLKWEEKAELNVGVDFALLADKLSGSIDYFKRNTTDLLNLVSVPSPPSPVTELLLNVGELETTGVELQLSYQAINKVDFGWTVDANFSTAKTTLVEFNAASNQSVLMSRGLAGAVALGGVSPIRTSEGGEIGQIYAQPFVGYDDDGEAIVLNLDGTEAVFDASQVEDQARNVGSALPDFIAGLNNTIRYKNFDINVFLRGTFGHSLVNETRAAYENVSGIGIRNVIVTEGEFSETIIAPHYSTRYVEDASFVKIDNATIGYTFSLSGDSPFRRLRIYVSGQNLATFTRYLGADPEVRYFDVTNNTEGRRGNSFASGRNGGLFPGIDRYISYPPTRTYSIGVNIEF